MTGRRVALWVVQVVLVVVLVLFVGRSVAENWNRFPRDVHLAIQPEWIGLAGAMVLATYALLIAAWQGVLAGWGHQLSFGVAARIWCLSNLGRYLPGKVWSVAGLAVLARRAGVGGGAAAAGAIAMQALAVGTGAAVVAVAAPTAASPAGLAAAIVVATATVTALVWRPVATRLASLLKPALELTPLPAGTALRAVTITALSWLVYGAAFWLLGIGLLGEAVPPFRAAVGVFAAGYVVGLLALFAPGGLGVRELVHVALLAPLIGSGSALALSVASRLLLTATEATAALAASVAFGR